MLNQIKLLKLDKIQFVQSVLYLNDYKLKKFKKINSFFFDINYIKTFKNNFFKKKFIINSYFLIINNQKIVFKNKPIKYISRLLLSLSLLKKNSQNLFLIKLKKLKRNYSCNFLGVTTSINKNAFLLKSNKIVLQKYLIHVQKCKKVQFVYFKKFSRFFLSFFSKQIGKNILIYLQKILFHNRKIRKIYNLSKYKYNFNVKIIVNKKKKVDDFFPIMHPLLKKKIKRSSCTNLKKKIFSNNFFN